MFYISHETKCINKQGDYLKNKHTWAQTAT